MPLEHISAPNIYILPSPHPVPALSNGHINRNREPEHGRIGDPFFAVITLIDTTNYNNLLVPGYNLRFIHNNGTI